MSYDSKINNYDINALCGRTPKSVLTRHYADYNPERLQLIYEEANVKVLT